MGTYRTAQVCLNGHLITCSADEYPELREEFCSKCGAETITHCTKCRAQIRGYYDVRGVVSLGPEEPRAFCHTCGAPYPWTAVKLEAARELADDLEELTPEERERLKGTLDDLIRETPRTQLASTRFKRIMSKVGSSSASAMRDIIVDVLSETAKKAILG